MLEQWQERVEAASKAQVDALQARIRPHFLFNSMNTIASLIRTRPAEAERTVEDLSDLFRAALGSAETPGTLGEELDLMDHYLRIEKLRLGDRLRVEIEADELPRDLPLPRLLLQPLVENAIYHGVQPLADGGTIRIAGRHLPGASRSRSAIRCRRTRRRRATAMRSRTSARASSTISAHAASCSSNPAAANMQ